MRVMLVDLRNHNDSADVRSLVPPHDMFNTAKDVSDLIGLMLLWHSLGAKVAFQFAQSCAHGDHGQSVVSPKQVWDLDSLPGENSYEDVDLLLKMYTFASSFTWVVNHLNEIGCPEAVSQWIGYNHKSCGDHKTWAFNLEGAIWMFNSHREASYWSLLEHPPKGMEIGIIVAEKNKGWKPNVIQQIETLASRKGNESEGKVSLHVLPNSGHWVHMDNLEGLFEILSPKMDSVLA